MKIPSPKQLKKRKLKNVQRILKLCLDEMQKETSNSSLNFRVSVENITDFEFKAVKEAFYEKGWHVKLEKDGPDVHNLHYCPPRLIISAH